VSTGLKNTVLYFVASTELKNVVLRSVFSTGLKNAGFIQAKLFQEAESRAKYSRKIFKIPYDIKMLLSCYFPAITSTFLPLRPANAGSDKVLQLKDRQRDKVMPGPSRPATQGAVSD
jgi:hypothetical protein